MDPYKSKSKSKIKIEKEIFKNYLREIWSDLSKRDSNLPNEQGIPRSLFYRFIRLPLIISERLFNILAIENPNHLSLNEFEYGMTNLFLDDYSVYQDKYATMKIIFDIYDFDGNGLISKDDISLILLYVPFNGNEYDYSKYTNNKMDIDNLVSNALGNKDIITFDDFEKLSMQNSKIDICHFLLNFIIEHNPFNNKCLREYQKQITDDYNNRYTQTDELIRPNRSNSIYSGIKSVERDYSNRFSEKELEKYNRNSSCNNINNYNISNSVDYSRCSTNSLKSTTTTTTTTEFSISNFARDSNNLNNFQCNTVNMNSLLLRSRYTSFKEEDDYLNNTYIRRNTTNSHKIENNYISTNNLNNVHIINDLTEILDFTSGSDEEQVNIIDELMSVPYYEGYLYKKSTRDYSVKKTYYKLVGKDFYFFKNQQSKKHQGMHYLSDVFIKTDIAPIYIGKNLYYPFSISYSQKEKIYYTKDIEERAKWGNILKEAAGIQGDITESYILKEDIANGHFGLIKKGVNIKTNEKVAVKVLQKTNLTEEDKILIISEIEIMKVLNNTPNIIHLLNIYENNDTLYLVMEYCDGGSLLSYLEMKNFNLSEHEAKIIIYNIFFAIAHIHSLGIMHRDIKIENILMKTQYDIQGGIRVTDFGFSTPLGPNQTKQDPYGTITYAAPEILEGKPYTSKIDLWSLGVLSYLLLDGSLPYPGEGVELINQIKTSEPNYNEMIQKGVSYEAVDFIKSLLQQDESLRPTVEAALRHRWFQNPN